MQSYSTIVGVVELRLSKAGYATTQKRYGIGFSTVTLIMNANTVPSCVPVFQQIELT